MIQLSFTWILILNLFLWPLWQLSVSYFSFRIPSSFFVRQAHWFSSFEFEKRPLFYERVLRVRAWKSLLPDGAWFFAGAFSKKKLASHKRDYLELFYIETCRGELAHWISFALFPVFALWNPAWAFAVMLAYALLANLPCILVQRYNRAQLQRVLKK